MTEYIPIGDSRVAFDREGSGEPLLLMHGAEASRHMFSALLPLLSRQFTVITYDQRDCGETKGPMHRRAWETWPPMRTG